MAVAVRRGGLARNIFATRSTEVLMAETQEEHHALKRQVGALDLTAIGVGAIIGSGIFVVVGAGANLAGPAVIISFGLAALTCLFAALSYSELAAAVPVSGSAYTYAYATMGEFVAWILGWNLILEYGVAVAAVSIAWAANLNAFLDTTFEFTLPTSITASPEGGGVFNLVSVVMVAIVTGLLIKGTRESARTNTIMVGIKLAVLVFFVIAGLTAFTGGNFSPFSPTGFDGIVDAAAIVFFAYIGFDAVAAGAEEARRPSRDLPIAIVGSLLVATLFYMVVSVTAIGLLPYTELGASEAPLAEGLEEGAGIDWASSLTSFGALVALTSVMIAMFFGQTRIFFAICRDGLFSEWLAEVNDRTNTPVRLTLAFGVLIAVIAAVVPFEEVVELINIGTLLAFLIVNLGVIVLRYTRPDQPRPFRTWSPVFPLIGSALCIYLMTRLPGTTWWRFFIWIAIGVAIYAIWGYRNSRLRKELPPGGGAPAPAPAPGSAGS
jgi:APA family basic amino acid/polyamine antiporter